MRNYKLMCDIATAIGLIGLSMQGAQAATLNIPTGASAPSPLFGAAAFTQRMVLFEEFGTQDYTNQQGDPSMTLPRPSPAIDPAQGVAGLQGCMGTPLGSGLDALIKNTLLYPLPGEHANEGLANPWETDVHNCLPNTQGMLMPMDGRPGILKDASGNPVLDANGAIISPFAHQRWNEFQPQKFFQSIMAGARPNGGARDLFQGHHYGKDPVTGANKNGVGTYWTEFGEGGLYYNTVTSPYAKPDPTLTGTQKLLQDRHNLYSTLSAAEQATENAAGCSATSKGIGCYNPNFEGTTAGIPIKAHPKMPTQWANSVWTFDGTLPPKLLKARYGETILFRHHNALPIDPAANNGFGTHTISTHEHNGHNPAESDGFAGAYFYPGQFYDYRWPMQLAGRDSINTAATDIRAGAPDGHGGIAKVPGDYRETMSTHWFHDHMIDFTAQNVYKGNAAMMNYYSALDRGNEAINDGVNLRLPSGTAQDWGNRDYDVNLVVADKAFDSKTGQLYFNPFNTDGFLGDVMTVNWMYKPYLDVRARKYRFRILNGSVSRYMKIAVVDEKGAEVPFHMIANDGNLMEHTVAFPNAAAGNGLPTQSIAERYDIVVDFAPLYAKGIRKVYLVNLMEHNTGAGPNAPVTLASAFNGTYKGSDLAIGKFMEFRLRPMPVGQVDLSMNPAEYTETVVDPTTKKSVPGKVLLARPTFTAGELSSAIHRTFVFGKKGAGQIDNAPWTISTDGNAGLNADVSLVSAAPKKGAVEIWHLKDGGAGWSHPAHIHFEEGQILYRGNPDKNGVTVKSAPPIWEKYARKDMYRIGPEVNSSMEVDFAIRVRDYTGTYVEHCHNTQHEDHAMLLRWDSQDPLHQSRVPTPFPDWDGVHYNAEVQPDGTLLSKPTSSLPTADTGDTGAAKGYVVPAGFGQPGVGTGPLPPN